MLIVVVAGVSLVYAALFWSEPLLGLRDQGLGLILGLSALAISPLALIALIVLLIRCAVSKRWRLALGLLATPVPIGALAWGLDQAGFNSFYGYFLTRRSVYLADLARECGNTAAPRLRAWSWGEEGGGFGNAAIPLILVYDESDTIAEAPERWAAGWRSVANCTAGDKLDVVPHPTATSEGQRNLDVESLGGHFYLVRVFQ